MKIKSSLKKESAPFVGRYTMNRLHFQEQMVKRKSAPTVGREKPLRALEFAMKSRKKSSIPFISILRIFECNIHNNPVGYLVYDRIPISVEVR